MPPWHGRGSGRLYRELITDALPSLRVRHLRINTEGWQNVVFEVNRAYIFRFPRSSAHAKLLATEIGLLPHLAARLRLRVPQPFVVGSLPGRGGWPFMGYRRIPGEPLDWDHVGPRRRGRLADDLGPFLQDLARFPAAVARRLGVPGGGPKVWRARHEAEFRRFRERGHRVMPPRLREAVDRLFRQYLGEERNFRWRPTLLHREVHGGHVLTARGRVTGVIDWGFACVGDPARELAYWAVHFGGEDLERLSRGRLRASDETFFERVRTYRSLIPVYHILGGEAVGDRAMVRSGLLDLRRAVLSPAEPGRP
jgi:aminoglycoside 2''-phosphotransferase